MGLLGCLIPYGGSLTLLRETAAIGKVAGIVGRDQLGVAIHGNDPLGVLLGRDGLLPGDHAENGNPLPHAALLIPGGKGPEQGLVLPALSALFHAKAIDLPADQRFVVHLLDAAGGKVGQQRPSLHISEDRPQHGMGVLGSLPFPQLVHVERKLLFVLAGEIPHLLAEGVGSGCAGPSGGILRHRENDLGFLLVHHPGLAEMSPAVQRDLDIRTGNDVADGG